MKKSGRWLFAAVPAIAAFFSFLFLAQAAWIPVKAGLAQWLIEKNWEQGLVGNRVLRPWPWADTRASAELSVPAHRVRQIVLEGNSGRNLAFGPVFVDGTLGGRDLVISGHRDTHFRFLKGLQTGDLIRLTTRQSTRWFEVKFLEVVDSRKAELVIEPGMDRLSLVTCYPFDSLQGGGPLRYVVTALPAGPPVSPQPPSSG